jgi:autotransporter-associated beta strand protein
MSRKKLLSVLWAAFALATAGVAKAEYVQVILLADQAESSISGGTFGTFSGTSGTWGSNPAGDYSTVSLLPGASGQITMDVYLSLYNGDESAGALNGVNTVLGGFYQVQNGNGVFSGTFNGDGGPAPLFTNFGNGAYSGTVQSNGDIEGTASASPSSGWWGGTSSNTSYPGVCVGTGLGTKIGTVTFTLGSGLSPNATDTTELFFYPMSNFGTALTGPVSPTSTQLAGFTSAYTNASGLAWKLDGTASALGPEGVVSSTGGTVRNIHLTTAAATGTKTTISFSSIPVTLDSYQSADYISSGPIAGLREMLGGTSAVSASGSVVTVHIAERGTGTFSLSSGGSAILSNTGLQTVAGGGSVNTNVIGWANTNVTGSQSDTITLNDPDSVPPTTVTVSGAVVTQRSVSTPPTPVALGRFMSYVGGLGTTTLSTSGDDNDYTRVWCNGTLLNSAGTATTSISSGSCAPGPVSGSINLPVLTAENGGAGLPGEGSYAGVIVSYSGTSVQNRVVTASSVNIGRQMAGATVSGAGGTTILTSTGADSFFTRVTVGGTLFNGTTTSGTATASGTVASVASTGYLTTLPTTGEGLAGESPISVTVNYTATPLSNRVVTATSTSFVIHLGQSVAAPITLSTTGSDSQYTRVTVNNAGPDANGMSVSGGTNPLFNGPTVTDSRTLAGTPAAPGVISGTISLSTNGEGLAGESPIPVQISYSGQVFSGNAAWNGGSGSWGTNGNWSDALAAGVHAAPGTFGVLGDSATLGPGAAGTITLDGANPSLAALTFNSSAGYTIAAGSGGTLTFAAASGPAVSVQSGTHSITAPVALANDTTINTALQTQLSISGGIAEASPATALAKTGGGILSLGGNNSYTGGTTVTAGTLSLNGSLSGALLLASGATFNAAGSASGSFTGQSGSTIVAAGNLTLGDSTSYTGFNHAGTLAVGANAVTLNSAGFANLGLLTTLSGGTLAAPNGVTLPLGGNLVGAGVVNAKIAAGYGSTINATGNLTLGDSTSPAGFTSDGELYTNANTVTLNSANAANNPNAVVLGSLTQLAGGSLVAPNGIVLDTGDNLVATSAGGTVSGGTASRFLNDGNVQGPSAAPDWLTFNLLFKGSTGQTSGRIAFLGGFATGDCPGVNNQYGATELGGAGTEFDVGGPTPGDANNNYGQLNILTDPTNSGDRGDLILSPGASLKIVDWNGYVPTPGETLTVLTWNGTLSGTASLAIDPAFAAEGIQLVPQWNSNSLVLEAVPEPSTFVLLCTGVLGLLGWVWRKRRRT